MNVNAHRRLLALCILLAPLGACASEQGEPHPDHTSEPGVEADSVVPEEDDAPPDAHSEDGQDLQTRLAKARFWRALVESPVPPHALALTVTRGELVVSTLRPLAEDTVSHLERIAARHLGSASLPWRIEQAPEPTDDEPHWRLDGARASAPPAERQLRQLAALADPDPFERDPRLEFPRDEPVPGHIVRAATGDRPLTYRVRAGDSLSLIAARTMGSGNHWQRIHELNRHIIGPDPARLMEGMELRIPQD